MSFLHPEFLWLIPLVAAPIIIHLLTRLRYRRVRWAAIDFLLNNETKAVRRARLQQILLMILRTLILAAALMALLEPILRGGIGRLLGGGNKMVILLDGSASMSSATANGSCFERGKRAALNAIAMFPRGTAAAFGLMAGECRIASREPLRDLRAVSSAIEAARLTDGAGRHPAGHHRRRRNAPAQRRRRRHLDPHRRPGLRLAPRRLRRLAVRPQGARAGRQARDRRHAPRTQRRRQFLFRRPHPLAAGPHRRGRAAPHRHRATERRARSSQRRIRLLAIGRPGERLPVLRRRARGLRLRHFPRARPRRLRLQPAQAQSRRALRIRPARSGRHPRRQPLLLHRQHRRPRAGPRRGRRARAPGRTRRPRTSSRWRCRPAEAETGYRSPFLPKVVDADALSDTPLQPFEAVFLADVPSLSDAARQRLDEYVQAGGLLVIFPGEHTVPAEWTADKFPRVAAAAVQGFPGRQARQGHLGLAAEPADRRRCRSKGSTGC